MLPVDHYRATTDVEDEGIFTPDEVNEILKQLEEEQAQAGAESREARARNGR